MCKREKMRKRETEGGQKTRRVMDRDRATQREKRDRGSWRHSEMNC